VFEFGNYSDQYKGGLKEFLEKGFWSEYLFVFSIMFGVTYLILLPLCLLKSVAKMRFTSISGIGSLVIIALIIVVELPWYIKTYDFWKTLNFYDVTAGFTKELYFFKGLATIFYAYSCHVGAFPVYNNLKNNTYKRTTKVFLRSILLDATFYIVVGVTGYMTQPIDTPSLIIERNKLFENDIVMSIARAFLLSVLFSKIPPNFNAYRISIFELIWQTNEITNGR